VLKFRSVSNIVIPLAKTGSDSKSRKAVIKMDQTKSGSLCILIPGPRILKIVVMKLIAPKILLAPETCNEKMPKSTAPPECAVMLLSGGYTVHPVPTPDSTKADPSNKSNDGGRSQKLILLSLGKAMSGLPIKIGTNQFP